MLRTSRISCHHGDSHNQNNLPAAVNIMRAYGEIDVIEIDFVHYGDDIISSHDYTALNILRGAPLLEWIATVVVAAQRVLWIDLKPRLDLIEVLLPGTNYAEKEALCLFARLKEATSLYGASVIMPRIIVSSQDPVIVDEVGRHNIDGWQTLADIPLLSSYIWQEILPFGLQPWLNDSVESHFREHYDFTHHNTVAIDCGFFERNVSRVLRFVEACRLLPDTILILYNVRNSEPPIEHPRYTNIITQYDFSLK